MQTRTDHPGFLYQLRDGQPVLIGPVLPDDKERIRVGVSELSAASRYLRFFSWTTQLTEKQLRYLTEVDQINHVAWCVLDPSRPGLPGLGLGRFVRLESDPHAAEWALAVHDRHHRRGIGTALLAMLYLQARHRNIRSLRGIVLLENDLVVRWLRNLGATVRREPDSYVVDLPVHPDPNLLPPTASANHFRSVLATLARHL